jgi:hypothetical protein
MSRPLDQVPRPSQRFGRKDQIFGLEKLRHDRNEIRIIRLLPGDLEEKVECTLEVVSLDDKPLFKAVSYVWGQELWGISARTKEIRINWVSYGVAPSLESVLRRARDPVQVITLWADAICINQDDVDERNQQVLLMSAIYRNCEEVLVFLDNSTPVMYSNLVDERTRKSISDWLPLFAATNYSTSFVHEDELDNAITYEHELNRYHSLPVSMRQDIELDFELAAFALLKSLNGTARFGINQWTAAQAFDEAEGQKILQELYKITQTPWWRRLWVVQEFVLAPKVTMYYKRFKIPWNYLVNASMVWPRVLREISEEDVAKMTEWAQTIYEMERWRLMWGQARQPKIRLVDLLWHFRHREATDPRDKVYAVLSLVNSWNQQVPIAPRYDWSVSKVYGEVVRTVTNVSGSLLILMFRSETSRGVPSWAPNWSIRIDTNEADLARLDRADLYNACNRTKPHLRILDDATLELRGIRVDVVASVESMMPTDDDGGALQVFRSWSKFSGVDEVPNQPYPREGRQYTPGLCRPEKKVSLHSAYWRTLCADTKYSYHSSTARLREGSLLASRFLRLGVLQRLEPGDEWKFEEFLSPHDVVLEHGMLSETDLQDLLDEGDSLHNQSSGNDETTHHEKAEKSQMYREDQIGVGEDDLTFSPGGPSSNRMSYVEQASSHGWSRVSSPYSPQIRRNKAAVDHLWASDWFSAPGDYIPRSEERGVDSSERKQSKEDLDRSIFTATAGRKLFRTAMGYLGLGPSWMRQGDLVWVFEGGHTPFLIRKPVDISLSDPGRSVSAYQFVGDCYVQGIMDGEAMTATTKEVYLI